jgi:acid stress-induced BolA-like protein IbaG/YrbA
MDLEEIRQVLESALGEARIEMQAEGNKLALRLVSDEFIGMNRVKRQQFIYTLLNDKISSGEIHAVTMKTQTSDEATNAG